MATDKDGYDSDEHLDWIADRLVNVHGDDPAADFVVKLREKSNEIEFLKGLVELGDNAFNALGKLAIDALEGCIDSLEYVNRSHPEATGCGVRDERIAKATGLIAFIRDKKQ